MKTVGYYSYATRYGWVIVLGVLLPNFALAAKAKPKVSQEACESKVVATFQKKKMDLAMASLLGNVSEIEATSAREGLERHLASEKAKCLHVAHATGPYAEAGTGSL
jgi:hypothetical protein